MRTSTHGEYLVRLSRFFGTFNAYLVWDEDGLTLIDALMPGDAKAILKVARQLGAPIVRIGITHAHFDHAGALDALHAALPESEVAFGARESRFLTGDLSLDPDEPEARPKPMDKPCQTKPTRLLRDHESFGPLTVLIVPGHTPGHVAFFDPRDRTLIVGDAMQAAGGVAVAGSVRPLFPFPALATWHKPSAVESARRMRALNPRRLATGHGPVVENPGPAIDRAIERAEGA